jgi:hypothetical protein
MSSIRKIEMNRRYIEGLRLFKHWGNDFAVIKSYLTSIFDHDLLGLRSRLERLEQFHVCDIGAGEGTITEHLLSLLLNRAAKSTTISVDLIEPENGAAEALMDRLCPLSSFPNLRFSRNGVPAEKFFLGNKPTIAYDLIFASHSFYFIDMGILPSITSAIGREGFLCTVLGAESSWMSFFKDFFSKQTSVHGGTFLKAFGKCVRKEDWATDHQRIGTRLDLSHMKWHTPHEIDETSKNVMSLILQRDFDDLSPDDRERVHSKMLPHMKNRHMILDGDYFLFQRKK